MADLSGLHIEACRLSAVEYFSTNAVEGFTHWDLLKRSWDGVWSYRDPQVSSTRIERVPAEIAERLEASYQKKYAR